MCHTKEETKTLVGITDWSGGGNEDGLSSPFPIRSSACSLGSDALTAVSSPRERAWRSTCLPPPRWTWRTKMSFVKQHAWLHKHCLHKHVMNERTEFAQSAQKIRADCAPPHRMISRFRFRWSGGPDGDGLALSQPALPRCSALVRKH